VIGATTRLIGVHAVRRLRGSPARGALLATAVALGVAVFVAVLYASEASVRSFERSIAPLLGESGAEIRARSGSLEPRTVTPLLRSLGQRFDLLPFWETTAFVGGRSVALLAVDPLPFAARFEGTFGSLTDGATAFAPESLITSLDISPGRTITLTTPYGPLDVAPVKPPDGLAGSLPTDTIVVPLEVVRSFRPGGSISGIKVWTRAEESEESADGAFVELATVLEHEPGVGLFLGNVQRRAEHASRLFGAFRLNIGVLVLMTLVVCGFTVFGAAQLSVTGLQRELGVMRTLGFTRGMLAAVVLSEAALVGFLGAVAGMTLGRPLTEWCARLFLNTVSVLYGGAPPPRDLWGGDPVVIGVAALLVGTVVAVSGALVPAWRASRVPPGIVGRGGGGTPPTVTRRSYLLFGATCGGAVGAALASLRFDTALGAHIAAFCLVGAIVTGALPFLLALARRIKSALARTTGVSGLIGTANLTAGARVSALAVGANGVGLALLVGLGVMVSSFRSTLHEWIDYTIRADLFIRPIASGTFDQPARLTAPFEAHLGSLPGVRAAALFAATEVTLPSGDSIAVGGTDFVALDGAREYTLLAGTFDRAALARAPTALVSEAASRKLKVGIGSSLELGGGRLTVVGVFKDFTTEHGIVLLELSQFRRLFGPVGAQSAALYLERTGTAVDDATLAAVTTAIGASPAGDSVLIQRNGGLREAILRIFDETFRITELMRVIVILITGLGFMLTLLQLHAERRADTTTLAVIGVDRAMLRGAVFVEGAVMLLPSIVLGLLGGTALALILIHLVNPLSFGWTLTFVPTPADYLTPIAVVAGGNLVGALSVALRSVAFSKESRRDE
jgi:putative ABC transport system permease protein